MSESAPTPAPPRLALHPCQLPRLDGAQCGTYEVYEDRKARAGRRIGLNIVVLKALGPEPATDPIFWLHGGPGAAATDTAGAAKGGFLEALRARRTLVFVDQRGTGQSNPLRCDVGDDPANLSRFFGELFPRDAVRECRRALEKSANLSLYTTPIAMDDLDDVRAALGFERIDIVAASYGTIAAQVYLRQHGEHVRAAFLIGVATPGIKQPLPFAKGAQHALDLLFEDCDADAPCHAAFPRLREEFEAILHRFDKGWVDATLLNPATRKQESVRIARANFVERLRLFLYTTTFARFVPLLVHRAFEGDYMPFESVAVAYNPGSLLARGMYFSVTCSEGVPFITPAEIASEARGTFVGEQRVRAHIDACQDWPRGEVPQSFIDPVESDRPVLMISGQADGSTPPWLGEGAVRHLSHGRQVEIRYYGHQIDTPCVWGMLEAFIERGSADGLDTRCTGEIKRPPFATELPPPMRLQ